MLCGRMQSTSSAKANGHVRCVQPPPNQGKRRWETSWTHSRCLFGLFDKFDFSPISGAPHDAAYNASNGHKAENASTCSDLYASDATSHAHSSCTALLEVGQRPVTRAQRRGRAPRMEFVVVEATTSLPRGATVECDDERYDEASQTREYRVARIDDRTVVAKELWLPLRCLSWLPDGPDLRSFWAVFNRHGSSSASEGRGLPTILFLHAGTLTRHQHRDRSRNHERVAATPRATWIVGGPSPLEDVAATPRRRRGSSVNLGIPSEDVAATRGDDVDRLCAGTDRNS